MKTLMVQGTASHAGKSVLVTALCRLLSRRGVRVAPFKALNMSNNATVTAAGREIAMAQAAQAAACGIPPEAEMNPVLLKPQGDCLSQVVVMGRALGALEPGAFGRWRPVLREAVRVGFGRLRRRYEAVVIEGAGSPAEINLRDWDIANMGVARLAKAPVILVGDIERGGLFAQMVGTLELLSPSDRARVRGLVINKFRGQRALLDSGIRWLEKRTGIPVLGVLPFLEDLAVPQEDGLGAVSGVGDVGPLRRGFGLRGSAPSSPGFTVQVIRYPALSNFNDLEPLNREPGVTVRFLTRPPAEGPLPDLLVLPGSKATVSDLKWLRARGFEAHVRRCVEAGAQTLGICGGFQMLGSRILDPERAESAEPAAAGLGLLPTETLFLKSKVTAQVAGTHLESGLAVRGYEIHQGRIRGLKRGRPVFRLTERSGDPVDELDGCRLEEKPVWGTYVHGLFDEPEFRRWFLNALRGLAPQGPGPRSPEAGSPGLAPLPDPYDALADAVERHLALDRLEGWSELKEGGVL